VKEQVGLPPKAEVVRIARQCFAATTPQLLMADGLATEDIVHEEEMWPALDRQKGFKFPHQMFEEFSSKDKKKKKTRWHAIVNARSTSHSDGSATR